MSLNQWILIRAWHTPLLDLIKRKFWCGCDEHKAKHTSVFLALSMFLSLHAASSRTNVKFSLWLYWFNLVGNCTYRQGLGVEIELLTVLIIQLSLLCMYVCMLHSIFHIPSLHDFLFLPSLRLFQPSMVWSWIAVCNWTQYFWGLTAEAYYC